MAESVPWPPPQQREHWGTAMPEPFYQDDAVTLFHGDARAFPLRLFADDAGARVMVTDPPYGIGLSSGRRGKFGTSEVSGDEDTVARDDVLGLWGDAPALVFGSWRGSMPARTRAVLIWEKGEHVGMGDLSLPWKPNWEAIYVIGEGWQGSRTGSVIKVHAIAGTVAVAKGRSHPTEKPVDLMRRLIQWCPPGVIVDPFAGSGTTLRAAKDLGRQAVGIEIEERYCAVAARRLAQEVFAT